MMMSNKKIDVVFYENNRQIKISRFFEVTKYVISNNLWKDVEDLMNNSPIIGERIIMDMHLANAVKIVMMRHASKNGTLKSDEIVADTVRCSSMPPASDVTGI
jgi:hypothetical protein